MTRTGRPRVLVIKHGALGDFLLALGPMQAIRRHHPDADLSLLTRPRYRDLAEASGVFDRVLIDDQPGLFNPPSLLRLRRLVRDAGADRVYDLQTSSRTAWYFRLCGPGAPDWSGKVPGCSLRHVYPPDHRLHTVERQRAQLALAGIGEVPIAELSFLDDGIEAFRLPDRIALLIPSASPDRPAKIWPAARYGALAEALIAKGSTPVVIGGSDAIATGASIVAKAPGTVDLTGATSLGQLAALARRARLAVGNDTGPTHLVSLAGCPTVALFGGDSDPEKTAPVGPGVRVVRCADLPGLDVATVIAALPPG